MKKITKKFLSLALAILMIAGTFIAVPVTVYAGTNVVADMSTGYKAITLDVPFYSQIRQGDCGISSIAMVEAYKKGYSSNDSTVYDAVLSHNNGSNFLSSYYNLGYDLIDNSLSAIYEQLKHDNPVIVYRTGTGLEHYSVVYGYNGSTSSLEANGFLVWNTYRSNTGSAVGPGTIGYSNLESWLSGAQWEHTMIRVGNKIPLTDKTGGAGMFNQVWASNITKTSARIDSVVPSHLITDCGFYIGTSETNMKKYVEDDDLGNGVTATFVFYNLSEYLTLSADTKYFYKIYFVSGGNTYTSKVYSFYTGTTPDSEVIPPPEVTVSWATDTDRHSVGETNAVLASIVTLSCSTSKIAKTGIYLYDADETLISSYFDPSSDISQIPEGTWFNMYYDVNLRLGTTLTPGTTYKYKFMVEIDGNTYYSPMAEFTTNGVNPDDGMGQGPTDDGECGDNLTWEFYSSTGELRTYGNGDMYDFSISSIPWDSYLDEIKTVTINSGATSIGDYAFYACSNLTSVTMPNSVTNIGENAFYLCTKLSNVTMSNGITEIGSYAFYCCNNLSSITITENVKSIGDSAFSYCGLTSVVIPDSVETIGQGAFVNYNNLTSIEVDENNANYCDINGVLFSKDKKEIIQYPAGASSTYVIPSGVTKVGFMSFYGCSNLTSVTIPNTVTTICSHAFSNCSNLANLTIPNSVTNIEGYAFTFCTSLDNLTIPESVTTIGGFAFANCSGLTSLTFTSKNVTLGLFIVDSCSNLKNIYCYKNSTADEYFSNEYYAKIYLDDIPVTGVTLNKSSATLTEGDTLTLTATVAPTNATNKNVTWKSSDTTVATVSNGVVTAKKAGTATITVMTADGSKTATCTVTVKAAFDPNALTFTVGSAKAIAGKTATVDIVISNNPGIAGFSFKVGYDSSVMTLIGYDCPGWAANSSGFDEDPANNPVGFSWSRTTNYTSNKTILTLTFEIKADAPAGEYDISLTTTDVVTNQDKEKLKFNLVGGKITVVESEPGDLSGDGEINSIDAVLLAQYIAGWDVELDGIAADCNGDGEINSIDAVLLAQYIAGWDVVLG
ncbi:MAG: leucine-rich repeat protein [Clostridia bacterium]|nr:leucine-rich repeat protein [Clostridia bacterium]